jgi:hypothetical protein
MMMDESILRELGTRYDIESLRARVPKEIEREVRGFDPQVVQTDGWRVSMRESLRDGAGRPHTRVVFDANEAPDERLLVEVIECSSPADALDALLERLAGNQLTRLPEGPVELGFAVYEHPAEAPPAMFFARDNVCVIIASFGSRPTPVRDWAERVVEAIRPGGPGQRTASGNAE